ncbi:MAG: hypothetical protein BroJett024_38380 [Alphaproteobacteria bacterium]|nr:MAG: hypothetical protein BroJett024_38380 [Alphaproteobacteria bacterium]
MTDKQPRIACCDRCIDLLEMHEGQCFAGDLAKGLRVLDQAAEYAGAALCGFIRQNGPAIVASGQWLAEDLGLGLC